MFDRKITDEIEKSKGYSIALLTTFNFEINYFERCILNTLYDNQIRKVEIFVDSNELDKSIHESKDNNLNRKYVANPITINSAFHPKVILLLGEEKAKLIVSSANIKMSGYTLNNEIYNIFEYNKENQENLNLINSAIQFFIKLNEMAYYKDEDIFNLIKEFTYVRRQNDNNDIKFIQNLDISVIEQLTNIIQEKVETIDIAVPYYDNELLAYKELKREFNCNDINLYIQNEKSTFPVKYNEQNKIVNEKHIKPYYVLLNNNKKNFYHGKVFRFNTLNKSYILYGSSNCTLSALSKTYKTGGNIECNILETGNKQEFNYFFDNFKLDYTNKLTCNILEYNSKSTTNYTFKYGIGKDNIELHFKYKDKKEELRIMLGNLEFEYEYSEKDLFVRIPESIMQQLNNIFDLTFEFNGNKEIIRCWFIDIDTINNFRNVNKEITFNDININGDMEKYRKYMELIVKTIALTKDEYSEQIKLKTLTSYINDDTQEDLDEDELDENFIIDKDIPDEYIRKSRDFTNAYIKSKVFAKRFFTELKKNRQEISNQYIETQNDNQEKKKPRAPTSAEKRFGRFIKSRIKSMLNKEYAEVVDYEHYKNSIGVIFDIINEFKYKEKIEDIFSNEYIIEISIELLKRLLEKDNREEEDKDSTIILVLIYILKNHMTNYSMKERNYRVEEENKKLLKIIDEKYNLRDSYKVYLLNAVYNINSQEGCIDYCYAENYIEGLFVYKTQEQLKKLLIKEYGDSIEIRIENEILFINSSTHDIKRYMNINKNIIYEILNHYNHYNKLLNRIVIKIENLKSDYAQNADPTHYLIYDINLVQKNYKKQIKRKSGNEDKPEYNTFIL